MGSTGVSPLIFNISTTFRELRSFTSQGKEWGITTKQEAGWVPELFWMFGRRGNLLLLPGMNPQFLFHPVCSLITIPRTLSNLH